MRGTVGRGGTSLDNQSYHRSKSKARVSRGLAQGGGDGSALHDIRQIRLRDDPTGLRQRQWDEVVVDGRLVVCRKKHGEATRSPIGLQPHDAVFRCDHELHMVRQLPAGRGERLVRVAL